MTTKAPNGFLPTNQPDLFFEDNPVGRMKKEVWEASDAQIDAILGEYGIPSPCGVGQTGFIYPDDYPLAGGGKSQEK